MTTLRARPDTPVARGLAALVPGHYHRLDVEQEGRPLAALLAVLARPLTELEEAVERLHDDHFIERASPEAVALLAELVGARLLAADTRANRAVVGATVGWQRRKGALDTLEEVLGVTSGWATEVDEAFRSLLHTQDLAHLTPWRGRTALVTDPVAIADPLSRRADPSAGRDGPALAPRPGETVEATLRRLGRADAGRRAASPRTIDLLGWARPDVAVVRSSRFVAREWDRVALTDVRSIAHATDAQVRFTGCRLDPAGRDLPLVGAVPVERAATGGLTAAHEPAPPAAAPVRLDLLTPTDLADAGDAADADHLSLFVDDVCLVGDAGDPGGAGGLAFAPVGPEPLLRFADASRPAPADVWDLRLIAVDDPSRIGQDLLDAEPATAVSAVNPAVVSTLLGAGAPGTVAAGPAADVPRGAVVALRIARGATGTGYRRDAGGAWTSAQPGEPRGEPISGVAVADAAGTPTLARLERLAVGGTVLATWDPADPAARWATTAPVDLAGLPASDRPDLTVTGAGPALALVADGDALLFAAPDATGATLAVWRLPDVTDPAPAPVRVDTAAGPRPPTRVAPSLCLHHGEVVLFGGQDDQGLRSDLWTLPLTGDAAGRWRPRQVRDGRRRVGATLLSTPEGVVLVGGAAGAGVLERDVARLDLTRPRPAWEALAPLPLPRRGPGTLVARRDGDAVEVVAWPDRVAAGRLRLGPDGWTADPPDDGSPNPPAEGEAAFVGDEVVIAGPPPLPASEILFRLGGQGRIAFLPPLDLVRDEDAEVFLVADDGATQRHAPPGEVAPPSLRLAPGGAVAGARSAPSARTIGVPGRLAWTPFRLVQRSLGPWDAPLALDLADAVALDPRLGRVALRDEVTSGRLSASFRVGRAEAVGAGFGPRDLTPPTAWREPPDRRDPDRFAWPTPPGAGLRGADVVGAWVAPARAGLTASDGRPIVADLAVAVGGGARVVGVLGSPRLPSARLAIPQDASLSVVTVEGGAAPSVTAADGVALSLHERAAAGVEDPDRGPTWYLAGLALRGALVLATSAGVLDVRWCDLGDPGAAGLRVAGAGHQSPLLHRTVPRARVVVRLAGCRVGRLEAPPWVEVVAAGCTFDGGSDDADAIAAAGASVRLRHCTVRGRTLAGRLEASSCAFKGVLVCDRPDQSWARYCLTPPGGRPPLRYRGLEQRVSFASLDPAVPAYLALAANNGATALTAGERNAEPGAYGARSQRRAELLERTDDFLPLGMTAVHRDRADDDLDRMHRREL